MITLYREQVIDLSQTWRQIKSSYPDEDSCLKLSQQIINVAFVQHSADFHGVAYDHIKYREVSYVDTVIGIGSVL